MLQDLFIWNGDQEDKLLHITILSSQKFNMNGTEKIFKYVHFYSSINIYFIFAVSSYPLTRCCVHHYSITSWQGTCHHQHVSHNNGPGWNVKCKVNHWDNGPFIGRVVGHLICMMGFLILNEEASARDAMGSARSCHDHWSDIVSWEEVRGSWGGRGQDAWVTHFKEHLRSQKHFTFTQLNGFLIRESD